MNPTDRVPLGRTAVQVTRLGLGLAPLGGLFTAVGDEQASATMQQAWQLGVRFFDTAPLYGNGLSERRGGQMLSTKPRDEYVLSTKVGRRLVAGGDAGQPIWAEAADVAPVWDFTAEGTRSSLAESLDRLGLDRVDVLHIHDPENHYEQAVTLAGPALVELRAQGRIGAVSVGTNRTDVLVDFARTGAFDCFLLAGRYTLLDQSGLTELLPLCRESGISIIIGGVFNSGILADPKLGATFDYEPAPADLRARALALRDVCARYQVPLRAAAVQFPFGHPAVASVLVGTRSPQEVADAVEMMSVPIPPELWRDIKRAGLLPQEVPVP